MTDTTNNQQLYNRSVALAEQETKNNTNMNNSTTEDRGITSQPTLDPAFPGYTVVKTCMKNYIRNLDVITGNWYVLPIWYGTYTDNSTTIPTTTSNYIWSWENLPINYLMGELHLEEYNTYTQGEAPFDQRILPSDGILKYHPYCQLLGAKIHLKNFMMTIERDSSGGVQMKDEPVFEIQDLPTYYATNYFAATPGTIAACLSGNVKQSTLKDGITIPIDLSTNVTTINNLQFIDHSTSQALFIKDWVRNDVVNTGYWPIVPRLNSVPHLTSLRMINTPAATNIKAFLSYEIELEATWHAYYKDIMYRTLWARPGTTVTTSELSNNKVAKKRKVT